MVCDDLAMTAYAVYHNPKTELKTKDKADLLEAFIGALYIDKVYNFFIYHQICLFTVKDNLNCWRLNNKRHSRHVCTNVNFASDACGAYLDTSEQHKCDYLIPTCEYFLFFTMLTRTYVYVYIYMLFACVYSQSCLFYIYIFKMSYILVFLILSF